MEYPQDLFTYGWKLLMQNHPHDSICGCSVDDVHREMITRFEKTEQVALHIISMCMDYLKGKINTSAVKEGKHSICRGQYDRLGPHRCCGDGVRNRSHVFQ